MIEIETRQLAGIPVLHAVPAGKRECSLPCIIFYHGFTSSSLVYSYFAVALAQAGFRVVMPDAPDHGARFKSDAKVRMHRFWHILQQNMQEFTTLRAALVAENWLSDERLAVGGASMGGMTALGIMARHPEVKCVASLMGSGYFTRLAQTLFPPLLVRPQSSRRNLMPLSPRLPNGMLRISYHASLTGRCCCGMDRMMMLYRLLKLSAYSKR